MHPNAAGHKFMAAAIYKALTGKAMPAATPKATEARGKQATGNAESEAAQEGFYDEHTIHMCRPTGANRSAVCGHFGQLH